MNTPSMCLRLARGTMAFLLIACHATAQLDSSVNNRPSGGLAVTITNSSTSPLSSLLVVFRQVDGSGRRSLNLTFLDSLYNEGQMTIPAHGDRAFSCGGQPGIECEFMGYGALFADGTTDGDSNMVAFCQERRRSFLDGLRRLMEQIDQAGPAVDIEKLKAALNETVERNVSYDPSMGTKTAPSAAWLGLRDAYQVAQRLLALPGSKTYAQLAGEIRETAKHKITVLAPAVKPKPEPEH